MNSKQKGVLSVVGILVLLMILFPPWEYFDNDSSGRSPAGYHFLLMPPPLKSPQEMFGVAEMRVPDQVYVQVDLFQIMFQLLVTIPIMAGLIPLLADKLTIIKTAFGVLLIGCGLFVLCFILWLEYSANERYGPTSKSNNDMHTVPLQRHSQVSWSRARAWPALKVCYGLWQ